MPDFKEVRTALIERWKFMGIEWDELPDDPMIFGKFANAEVTVQYVSYWNSVEKDLDLVHLTCKKGWRTEGTTVPANGNQNSRHQALLTEVQTTQAYVSQWLCQLQNVDNALYKLLLQKEK